jgi:hypothetical protein
VLPSQILDEDVEILQLVELYEMGKDRKGGHDG